MHTKAKKIIQNLKHPGDTLSHRVVRSGLWIFALRIVNRGFSLIRLIILARILAPHDFGLLGIALLTIASLEIFSETGFQEALIQKKEDIKSHLDAAWTVLILRSFILFAILYLIAPYAALFFNEPEAGPIIQIIGFSILIQGFTNIGVIYFQKELEFKKLFVFQFCGVLADFIVAVSAALILRNVWALVFGILAGTFVRCIMSYLIHPFRPHLDLNLGKAKELFGFGRYILGTSILKFFILQGDDVFLGKMLGAATLGLYQMAYRISNLATTEVSNVITQVTFPAYSKLQDEVSKLKTGYLKSTQLTTLIAFPIAGGIFILAPELTQMILGDKWLSMVPAMQVLCILGALKAVEYDALFKSVGRPVITTKVSVVRLGIMAVSIYPLTMKWGMLGTAISVLVASFSIQPWVLYQMTRIINYSVRDFLKLISFPLIATLAMVLVVAIIKNLVPGGDFISLFFLIAMGVIVYLILIYISTLVFDYKVMELLKEIRKGVTKL